MKIVKKKSTENCHFTAVKNRCILHGCVFVMFCRYVLVRSQSTDGEHILVWI